MFRRNHYDILVVDDEPDVIQVTKMALRGFHYRNATLKIHAFESKEQAWRFLQTLPDPTSVAVALVDVVMETGTAGLELCDYIRTALKNDLTQLVIRTGQAGKAPQRQVVESYEINEYLAKTEATPDRLYCLMVSCLRQYDWAFTSLNLYRFYNTLLPGFRSRQELKAALRSFASHAVAQKNDPEIDFHSAFIIDDDLLGFGVFTDENLLAKTYAHMKTAPGRALNDQNDSYSIHNLDNGEFDVLLSLGKPKDSPMPGICLLSRLSDPPSEYSIKVWHRALFALRRFAMIGDFVSKLQQK